MSIIALLGEIFILIIFIFLTIYDPTVNFFSNYISDHANGPYRQLFRISLIIHGIGMFALVTNFYIIFPKSRIVKVAVFFLGIAAIGTILGGIFSIDPPNTTLSLEGLIHKIAAFASSVIELTALYFFIRIFKKLISWRSLITPTLIFAIIGSMFLVWLNIAISTNILYGLAERALFLIFILWGITISIHILSIKKINPKSFYRNKGYR